MVIVHTLNVVQADGVKTMLINYRPLS